MAQKAFCALLTERQESRRTEPSLVNIPPTSQLIPGGSPRRGRACKLGVEINTHIIFKLLQALLFRTLHSTPNPQHVLCLKYNFNKRLLLLLSYTKRPFVAALSEIER